MLDAVRWRAFLSNVAQIIDVVKLEWAAENAWSNWDQGVRDELTELAISLDGQHNEVLKLKGENEKLAFELKAARNEVAIADGEIERLSKDLHETERLRDEWCAEYTKLRDMRSVQ